MNFSHFSFITIYISRVEVVKAFCFFFIFFFLRGEGAPRFHIHLILCTNFKEIGGGEGLVTIESHQSNKIKHNQLTYAIYFGLYNFSGITGPIIVWWNCGKNRARHLSGHLCAFGFVNHGTCRSNSFCICFYSVSYFIFYFIQFFPVKVVTLAMVNNGSQYLATIACQGQHCLPFSD